MMKHVFVVVVVVVGDPPQNIIILSLFSFLYSHVRFLAGWGAFRLETNSSFRLETKCT